MQGYVAILFSCGSLAKDIRDACAHITNPYAKPKASETKTALIHKRVFGDFLWLAPRHCDCMRRM